MNASILNHAIRHAELCGLDIGRLALDESLPPGAVGLLCDAAEHHARLTDLLARVQSLAAGRATLAAALPANVPTA